MNTALFPPQGSKLDVETGTVLQPKFDKDGLIPAVVTDTHSGEVLMVGYMNDEALKRTIETGEAWYWSRSRREYWKKGATSGQIQKVEEIRIDCDQDAVVLKVHVQGNGATCHVGHRSCFFRRIVKTGEDAVLAPPEEPPVYDPKDVYGQK